jgi:hypothetical protein
MTRKEKAFFPVNRWQAALTPATARYPSQLAAARPCLKLGSVPPQPLRRGFIAQSVRNDVGGNGSAEGRRWGSLLVSTLIVALWPQVSPTVAWALTCVAWGCVPACVVRIIPP